MDAETKQVLIAILGILKQHSMYLHRQHGWLIAVAETIEKYPELEPELKKHPFYDQGPNLAIQKTDVMIQNIDALILRLKD